MLLSIPILYISFSFAHEQRAELLSVMISSRFFHKIPRDLTHIVIIGIGGSSLGLKAIDTMLYHLPHRNDIVVKFLEHTDPLKIQKSLKKIRLHTTLFIVISKSGMTIETTSLMKYS